jgi:hypothetical protein
VTISNQATSPSTSRWVMPLGQTPPYLDPQSQEALYEVDVSGMPLNFTVNRHQMMETGPSLRRRNGTHQTSIQ